MNAPAKKIAIVYRQAPYGTSSPLEALDAALASSAFAHDVSLVFMDDAVYWLKKDQQGSAGQKTFAALISSLALYDIEQLYVDLHSLMQRGLTQTDLVTSAKAVEPSTLNALLSEQDIIL